MLIWEPLLLVIRPPPLTQTPNPPPHPTPHPPTPRPPPPPPHLPLSLVFGSPPGVRHLGGACGPGAHRGLQEAEAAGGDAGAADTRLGGIFCDFFVGGVMGGWGWLDMGGGGGWLEGGIWLDMVGWSLGSWGGGGWIWLDMVGGSVRTQADLMFQGRLNMKRKRIGLLCGVPSLVGQLGVWWCFVGTGMLPRFWLCVLVLEDRLISNSFAQAYTASTKNKVTKEPPEAAHHPNPLAAHVYKIYAFDFHTNFERYGLIKSDPSQDCCHPQTRQNARSAERL